jgi:hypothetical protein
VLVKYLSFSLLAFVLEFWIERIGRPSEGVQQGGKIRSGEDLEAKGLVEYAFDVIYWTWGCLITVALFGERAWWLWVG